MNKLPHEFTFWYHNPNDTDWTRDSYHQILTVGTVEEFWLMCSHIKKDSVENGMFFMMLDDVFPIWEDPNNINGGSISWKVEKKFAYQYWIDTMVHFLSGNLPLIKNITGISINSKKGSNIVKVWFKDDINDTFKTLVYPKSFKLFGISPLYKTNCTQIERDRVKHETSRNSHAHHSKATHAEHTYAHE